MGKRNIADTWVLYKKRFENGVEIGLSRLTSRCYPLKGAEKWPRRMNNRLFRSWLRSATTLEFGLMQASCLLPGLAGQPIRVSFMHASHLERHNRHVAVLKLPPSNPDYTKS